MGELSIITGGVLIEGDRIVQVGEIDPDGAQIIDAGGKVVLPGWVDSHTHALFAGERIDEFQMRSSGQTYEQIAEAGGGIRSSVRATRAASEDELAEIGRKHAGWFLQGGTTTIECKTGYGLDLETELKMLRAMRRLATETPLTWVPTLLAAHAVPPEFEGDTDGYVDLVCSQIIPAAAGLAKYADIFVERGYFTPDHARRVMDIAGQHGLGIRMHVDQLTDTGGAALAAELGAISADHLEQTPPANMAGFAKSGTFATLLPASVYSLGLSKYPDARTWIDSGAPVVLATDFNPGSSPTPSMTAVLSLACTHMQMRPAEAVTAATINAAYSLGLGDDRGSIEPGKRADLAIYDVDDYRRIPYHFGLCLSSMVFIGGKQVL
jgi:imidazolonepropionase